MYFISGIVLALFWLPVQDDAGYVSLFDGETLQGWVPHEGLPESDVGGKWEVVNGAITGDQEPPGRGGLLRTTGRYQDFILKFETKIDDPADSGIFLRVGEDGKSHQVTLDNVPEGTIGSVYLPWTQGMVFENSEGAQHFRQGEWNEGIVRIEGQPARIRFWLNGRLVTDFQHTEESSQGVPESGYIAVQIHPGDRWKEGNKVRFRNIRIKEL